MKRQVRINGFQHSATRHYMYNYGYVPLWILVKVLSFGIVSEMYSILKIEDRIEIAKNFNVSAEDLSIYLPLLSNYRNLCAHEDILYENKTQRMINDTVYHKMLGIDQVDSEYVLGKNDIFSFKISICSTFLIFKASGSTATSSNKNLDCSTISGSLEIDS